MKKRKTSKKRKKKIQKKRISTFRLTKFTREIDGFIMCLAVSVYAAAYANASKRILFSRALTTRFFFCSRNDDGAYLSKLLTACAAFISTFDISRCSPRCASSILECMRLTRFGCMTSVWCKCFYD